MANMYGAKAVQIAKIAKETWQVQAPPATDTGAQDKAIQDAIFAIDKNNDIALTELKDIPQALQTEEFIRLVIALADCPLVS